ncbi:hypothetical protein [Dyella sp. ASV21]|uniref:hypothetical protein n=1 Tax=Dyella sp. ASV21 TaxID=2795114 RepID=UPI0018EBEDED|nr:hypothetical protein [Dyella sp. ASV21]
MSQPIVIEWERLSLDGDFLDYYLARMVEPYTTGNFATVYRDGPLWRLVWYPNLISTQVQSFELPSIEPARRRVERWAARQWSRLRELEHPGYCAFYAYERHALGVSSKHS